MNLTALMEIGETILDTEFDTDTYPCAACTTPWTLDDEDLDVELRVKFRLHGDGATVTDPETITDVTYDSVEWVDLDDTIAAAQRHMYAHQDQHIDYSLTRRVTSNSYSKRFNGGQSMAGWLEDAVPESATEESLTDVTAGEDFLADLHSVVSDPPEALEDELREADDTGAEKAVLAPVFVTPDGEEEFAGDSPIISELTDANVTHAFEESSAAKRVSGDGVCAACDADTTVYGLGGNNIGSGRFLPFKRQGVFPEYAATNAWRARPLCSDCIKTMTVALNLFVGPQDFDIPQIRCRIIPYVVGDNSDVLRGFTELYRENVTQGVGDELDAFIDVISKADDVDALRFFVMFYRQDIAKLHGIHSVEGVSAPAILAFAQQYKETCYDSPVRNSEYLKKVLYTDDPDETAEHANRFVPSLRQLLSGAWFYRVFFQNRNRKGNGESTPDPGAWRELFESLVVDQQVSYDAVIRETMRELYEADADEDYGTSYHLPALLSTHYFIEACNDAGYLTGSNTDDVLYPTMDGLTDTYESYGDAVASLINNNPGLGEHPGRETAFTLGVLAARLSAWQQQRGNSRTFIDNNELVNLDAEEGERWVTRIWEKALTYNQQEHNGGVPWQDVYNAFHEANTAYKQSDDTISTDEYRYYYVQGVNIGNALNVTSEDETSDETEATTAEAY